MVYSLLEEATRRSIYATEIKPYAQRKYGRSAWAYTVYDHACRYKWEELQKIKGKFLWILNETDVISALKSSRASIKFHLFNCRRLLSKLPFSCQLNIHMLVVFLITPKTIISISLLIYLAFTSTSVAWETILKILLLFSFLWISTRSKVTTLIRTFRLLVWILRVNFKARRG